MKKIINFAIIILFLTVPITLWGNEGSNLAATQDAYFDTATGHKYLKNSDDTYAEYSRKGKLLRKGLLNSCSLLTSGRYIREIVPGSYLLYEKTGQYRIEQIGSIHPKGWKSKDIIVSLKNFKHLDSMGLGYSNSRETILYDGKQLIATGFAYYDIVTGHKYFKSSEFSYSEYSKKGSLLRANVPNNLPLLTSGRHIFDMNQDDYAVYEKRSRGGALFQILPATSNHPQGWFSSDLLVSRREL